MLSKLIPLLVVPALTFAQAPAAMQDTALHPISVQEAVRLAQEGNVAAVTSSNSIRSSQNQVRSARAQYIPDLRVSAGQSRSAGDRIGQNGTLVPYASAWSYNTGLSSSLTLFDGGKTAADIRTQKANVAAAEAGYTSTQFNLALQVKTQYNLILAAKESETAARAQLALAEQQLATSIAKVNAGSVPVSDSLRSVVAVGNARLAILSAQQSQRTASAALTHLVGTPYFVTAVSSDTTDMSIRPIDSVLVMQMAASSPVVRQSEAQLAASAAAERAVKAQYRLPSISASFGYNANGVSSIYGLNNNPFPFSKTASVSASYALLNRFTRENSIAAAQISYDNAEAQLKDQRLSAQQNIITQLGTLKNAEERMRVQALNVRASEEDLRVTQQRYALGAAIFLDVLSSQSALTAARQQLIQARFDYRNARAQIEATIGRDLP